MEEYLIVDGYNMIGAWPELQKLQDISLEQARDRLIEILADYQAVSGYKVYLVFDAYYVPGAGGTYKQRRLQVIYTKEKETADERIERLVGELSGRRRRIVVATSDLMEQHVIFGQGALRLPARELLVNIQQSGKEVRSQIEQTKANQRNTFDSRLSTDLKSIFEKWRRNKH